MLWDDWYRQLEQLPNESAEWNEIEAFIKRIQNLCEDRKRQQSQDTQALNSALSRLRDQFLSDLMFFQLDMVVEWLEHGVIFINHRAACDALMAMAQSFDEYHESKQKPVSTVVDDRRKREGLATLESHITQLYDGLVTLAQPISSPHSGTAAAELGTTSIEEADTTPSAVRPADKVGHEPLLLDSSHAECGEEDDADEASTPGIGEGFRGNMANRFAGLSLSDPPGVSDLSRRRMVPSRDRASLPIGSEIESAGNAGDELLNQSSPVEATTDSTCAPPSGIASITDYQCTAPGDVSAKSLATNVASAVTTPDQNLALCSDSPAETTTEIRYESPLIDVSHVGRPLSDSVSSADKLSPVSDAPSIETSIVANACDQMTVRQIAQKAMSVSGMEREAYLPALIWRLVGDERHGLAYHLSMYLEANSLFPEASLPSWLIAAVALGLHVRHADGEITQRLREHLDGHGEDCFRPHDECWNRSIRLLLAAASLRPSLLAPATANTSRLLGSLHRREGLTRFYDYCQKIAVFGENRQPLEPSALKKNKDQAVWQQELAALKTEVEDWCSQAPRMSILYQAATNVWRKWQEPGELIHRLLQPVRHHDLSRRDFVHDEVQRLTLSTTVRDEIQFTDRRVLRRIHGDAIDGKAVGQIQGRVRAAVAFARRWMDLVDCAPSQARNFLQRAADDLRHSLRTAQKAVLSELEVYGGEGQDARLAAGLGCCRTAVKDLGALFDPEVPLPLQEPAPRYLLHADLLQITSLTLDDQWTPTNSDSPHLVQSILSLLVGESVDWPKAYKAHCDARNHEATARILEFLQAAGPHSNDGEALARDRDQRLAECRQVILREVNEARNEVERAVALGLLDERERGDHDALLVSIEHASQTALDFRPLGSCLMDAAKDIAEKRARGVESVRRRLHDLALLPGDPWLSRIERCLERGDVLTGNEYVDMAHRREPIEELGESTDLFRDFFPDKLRALDSFLDATPPPEILQKVRQRVDFGGISFASVPGAQSDQAFDMLSAWFLAKRQSTSIHQDHIERILRGLGWAPSRIAVNAGGPPAWVDITIQPLSDRNRCPVAYYGSLARGEYRLMCVWNRPSEDELLNLAGRKDHVVPLIVLHFGRMSEKRRRDLARLSRREGRTMLVLDDTLMVWLCGQRGSRSPALFACALPFTLLAPYTDTAGLVPPEMFYGRQRERDSVASPTGSCFIFGGRQLGKTALLRDVERTVHAPERGQIALWLDLRVVGIGYDREVNDLWSLLTNRFKDLKVVPGNVSGHVGADRLLEHVEAWLNANPVRRILLLLDEADRFLDHDGKQEFVHSARLKGLMDRTDRRFKVVFAGLHNVQRTTRQSNHPLAHYQEPICIGPLLDNGEWREARSLIERPLASLGYRFESPDLVTRILSQTNYYPSLIQLYCKELLQHVSNHKVEFFDPRATPPFIITAKHVEGAYQSQELRNTIRQKLSLTLQLDPRYEVIAYALAFHFLSTDPDAVVSGVPVSWIRNQALDWWADGFKDANSDDSIRVLADEMVGLGVFRQVAPDCYTLRSPNVISLLGDPRQIASELERSRELPPEFEAATFRGVFPDKDAVGGLWRSPLTAEQQAELRSRENGVSILFGCEAAGLKDLAAALPAAVESEFYVGVNDAELSTFRDLLGGLGNREKNGTTLFHVAPSCSWDQVWVHEAMERLERLTSTTAFVRFLFIADATKTFELLTKNGDLLLPKSPRMRAISLRPWHDAAIRQWLEDSHLPSDKPHREKIYQATGNWSLLLRQLHGASLDDPGHFELHIQKIADSLVSTAWATEISRSLGLYLSEPATLLTTLVQLERATQEELTYVVDGASSDSIRRSLRWADLLGLATRTRSNEWVVDPVVARILTILRK